DCFHDSDSRQLRRNGGSGDRYGFGASICLHRQTQTGRREVEGSPGLYYLANYDIARLFLAPGLLGFAHQRIDSFRITGGWLVDADSTLPVPDGLGPGSGFDSRAEYSNGSDVVRHSVGVADFFITLAG